MTLSPFRLTSALVRQRCESSPARGPAVAVIVAGTAGTFRCAAGERGRMVARAPAMPMSSLGPTPGELDEVTLRLAQRGDERAWRTLIACHQDAIHGLIWRLLAGRARHRVEDLAQETFVRVLRALPRFDPHGPATLRTWMLTIATRLTLNELRRPEMASLSAVAEPAVDETATIERRRLAARIGEAMAALPPYQRAVVV